jgi:hypothetical protein
MDFHNELECLSLLANIILGWKGLPRTNTQAYYENPLITAVKSFIVQALCYKNCYAPSNLVISRIRYTSICSVPYSGNYYDASKADAMLLEA